MDFVGNVMDGSSGISWFYIVGLLIFIILFIVIVYRTVKIPRNKLKSYKESILDSSDRNSRDGE
jgi:hypothetical protein